MADHIYHCTDSGPVLFDFISPGKWVHAWKPIEYVSDFATRRAMTEADVIKVGWSVSRLWLLWSAMAGGCVAIGLWAAWGGRLLDRKRAAMA